MVSPNLVTYIDIEKIGEEFSLTTPNGAPYSIYSRKLAVGEVASFNVRMTKRSQDSTKWSHFEFTNVFLNDAGTIRQREQTDTVFLRGTPFLCKSYFTIIGDTIHIMVESGFAIPCDWIAVVAVIAF